MPSVPLPPSRQKGITDEPVTGKDRNGILYIEKIARKAIVNVSNQTKIYFGTQISTRRDLLHSASNPFASG